jgi:PTS system nitrogen regulatory IIA component
MSTMIPNQILKPGNVLNNISARSKKHCLEILSELLAHGTPAIPGEEIFSKLIERERLGTTGLGNGIAFPHCRFTGIDASHGALLKLSEAIEFDSPDGQQVDLVFGLMVPREITDQHREEIAEISALLNDPDVCARLRSAGTSRELYEVFLAARHSGNSGVGTRSALRGS